MAADLASVDLEKLPRTRKEALASGTRWYFTGKPCARGHLTARDVSEKKCLECRRARVRRYFVENREECLSRNRAYQETHRDAIRASWAANCEAKKKAVVRVAAWRKANPEKAAELRRKWKAENPDKVRASNKAFNERNKDKLRDCRNSWKQANAEHIRETNAKWRAENRERQRVTTAAWRAANPEQSRAIVRNRRARIRSSEGTHSADDILELLRIQKNKCANCLKRLGKSYHVDHIIPVAKGGDNGRRNLQILCGSCNRKKSAFHPIEFARRQGRLL